VKIEISGVKILVTMTENNLIESTQEPSTKRWKELREVAKECLIASEKFSFAIGYNIVIDGGTILL
jgi:hypothetical protein